MPLNHVPSAEILLRLFNIQTTWEKTEAYLATKPKKGSLLLTIIDLVLLIDKERAGRMFPVNPSMDLLEAAYNKGLRFEVIGHNSSAADGHHCCGCHKQEVKVNIKLNNQVVDTVVMPYGLTGLSARPDLFKALHQATYGTRRPQYNFKDIGAYVLNELSHQRYVYANLEKEDPHNVILKQKPHVNSNIYVRRELNLPTINQQKLSLLEQVLQASLLECGYSDAKFTLKLSGIAKGKEQSPVIRGFLFSREVILKSIQVQLECANTSSLNSIDFMRVLTTFQKRAANLAPGMWSDVSAQAGDIPSKANLYQSLNISNLYDGMKHMTEEEVRGKEREFGVKFGLKGI